MASMKMSGCMNLAAKMHEDDQDKLLQRLDEYQQRGLSAADAQRMAAHDTLTEAQMDREEFLGHTREQHADLFPMARGDEAPQTPPADPNAKPEEPPRSIPDQEKLEGVEWKTAPDGKRLVRLHLPSGMAGLVVDPHTLAVERGPERFQGKQLSDLVGDHITGQIDDHEGGFAQYDHPGGEAEHPLSEPGQLNEEKAPYDAQPSGNLNPTPDTRTEEEKTKDAIGSTFEPPKKALMQRAADAAIALQTPEGRAVLKASLADYVKHLGEALHQNVVDQYAPLKKLGDRIYQAARMSTAGDSSLEAQMFFGKVFMNGDAPDVKFDGSGGFMGEMAKLKGEHQQFLYWIAAHRAEKLDAEGRENLMSRETYKQLQKLDEGKMADGTDRAPLYAAARESLREYNEAALKLAMDSGLVNEKLFNSMKDDPYVPFFRVMEETEGTPRWSTALTGQEAWKKLKGGSGKLPADMMSNVLKNWSHVYTAAAKNRASNLALKEMESMGLATRLGDKGEKGSVWTVEHGSPVHYMVHDSAMAAAVGAMHYTMPSWQKPLQWFKQTLTHTVTALPAFKLRNFLRDTLQSPALDENLPANVVENMRQGAAVMNVKGAFHNLYLSAKGQPPQSFHPANQTFATMLASGAFQRMGPSTDGARGAYANSVIRRATRGVIVDGPTGSKLMQYLDDLNHAYKEATDAGEQISRVALFNNLKAKGYSNAEAAFASRDLMDFSLQGKSAVMRFIVQTVPFLNARIQGLYKLGRAATSGEKYDAIGVNKRFANIAGAVSLLSLGLMLAQQDDPDWQGRADFDRDAYWWLKIGNTAFKFPKPFEVGAIGTLSERLWEAMFDKTMTARRFGDRMTAMVFDTFAMNPTPQALKPMGDVYANKNSFTGESIETDAEQKLMPADRYDANTSLLARGLGSLGIPNPAALVNNQWNPTTGAGTLSPKQVDYLLQGYFGGLATLTTGLMDFAGKPALGMGSRPAFTQKELTGGFTEALPGNTSRYVQQFYDRAEQVDQAFNTYRAALQLGDFGKAQQVMADKGDLIRQESVLASQRQTLATLALQARRVANSPSLTADEKREQLDSISQRRNALASNVDHALPPY
jgi:hypothetical protein